MLHHKQTIFGEEMHTLIKLTVSVMASNIWWMAYFYKPLIYYIRSHIRLCSYIVRFPVYIVLLLSMQPTLYKL